MFETITTIASLAITAVSIIVAITKGLKTGKSQKIVDYAKIVKKIPDYINEAEQVLGEKQGAAKLQYVLNKLHIECLQNEVEYIELDLMYEVEKILTTPQKKEKE